MALGRRRRYKTIPEEAEAVILALADQYPGLGQNGLQDEVERLGYRVDPYDLKRFLRQHGRGPSPAADAGYRRRGMWDTGWPTWTDRNPVGEMEWPDGREPFEHRFPYWGWAAKQPLWFRLVLALPAFGIIGLFVWRFIMEALGR